MDGRADVELIDVSVGLTDELPIWPGSPGVGRREILSREAGDPVNATELRMDVHCGTHIDAPRHFIDDGATLEQISLARLIGPTYVVDVGDANVVTAEVLDRADVPPGTRRLLLKTANSADPTLYQGPFREEYVAVSPDGATWLRQRGVDVVGIDYLSIQRFDDPPDTHVTLLGAGMVIIEGLRLTDVEGGWHEMMCLPIALDGAEAAPARVVLRPLSRESD